MMELGGGGICNVLGQITGSKMTIMLHEEFNFLGERRRETYVSYRSGATFDISQDVKLLQARFGGDTVWTKMLSPISH